MSETNIRKIILDRMKNMQSIVRYRRAVIIVSTRLAAGRQAARGLASAAEPELDSRNRLVKKSGDITDRTRTQNGFWPSIMGVGGLSLLAYNHFDAALAVDCIGASMVAGAVISSVLSSKHHFISKLKSSSGEQLSTPGFEFKIINDDTVFSAERELLDETVVRSGPDVWPSDIQRKLDEYRSADRKKIKNAISARKDAMHEMMSAENKYSSEREALSALAPRAFLLDYIDPMPPQQRGSSYRKDYRSRADQLGEEVSLLIACAASHDVVIINLTSPGGSVIEYGLASSHLLRLKKAGIRTIVTVDKVAASGGFMMACCADEIVAAPFAYLGSIGVIAELPNFHKILNKNEVDYFMFTAGKFKRTVSLFNEVSVEGKEKFQEELNSIHTAFKQHVSDQRGDLMDVEKVATGEAWLAVQCQEYGLVDRLGTSWDVIKEMADNGYDVVKVKREEKRSFFGGLRSTSADISSAVADGIVNVVHRVLGNVSPLGQVNSNINVEGGNLAPHNFASFRSENAAATSAR